MKKVTVMDPHVSLNLRVFVEGDVYEMAVALSLVFWFWWKDSEDGLDLDSVAVLGSMSRAQAAKVLSKMKKKGWVDSKRSYGGKNKYSLTVSKMSFKEAYEIMSNRLLGGLLEESTEKTFIVHPVDSNSPPSGLLITKDLDLPNSTPKTSDFFAEQKSLEARKKEFTDYFQQKHLEAHKSKPIFPNFAWFWNGIKTFVEAHPQEEQFRRVDNFFADAFLTNHSFQDFIKDPDKFIEKRVKFEKGSGGRGYAQPEVTDWKLNQGDK